MNTESLIQILSYFQDKVWEMIVYFRAHFGEEWYETALILMRITLVLFKVEFECINLFIMLIHQWKYSLYKHQQNTSENRDSVIKLCLFKINMYSIYILDSSRNEYVQVMYHYLNQFSIIENVFAVQVSINNMYKLFQWNVCGFIEKKSMRYS